MADYFAVKIYIGVTLNEKDLHDFIVNIKRYFGYHIDPDMGKEAFLEWLNETDCEHTSAPLCADDGCIRLFDPKTRYGAFSDLEDYLDKVGLYYIRYSEGQGEYNAEVRWLTEGMESPKEALTDASENVVSTVDLFNQILDTVAKIKDKSDLALHINDNDECLVYLAKWGLQQDTWSPVEAIRALTNCMIPQPPASPGAFTIN